MEIIEEYEYDVPCWAICAIEYNDESGLSAEDVETLHEWYRSLRKDGLTWGIVFTSEVDKFNPHPAFGLPCDTDRARVYYYR